MYVLFVVQEVNILAINCFEDDTAAIVAFVEAQYTFPAAIHTLTRYKTREAAYTAIEFARIMQREIDHALKS